MKLWESADSNAPLEKHLKIKIDVALSLAFGGREEREDVNARAHLLAAHQEDVGKPILVDPRADLIY
ncbi:hypothetical protein CIB48_g3779 [Xylaria polymorpha]|nr:hypothetical protein CIB48_g3779 [Xylaria polymorpha]